MKASSSLSLPPRLGRQPRGVQSADVERTADALLRAGERPTVEKIRAKLGTGSPNTINPLLDQWWQRLSGRLDAGPKSLNRLPEEVIHAAETLWYSCLDQARINTTSELRGKETTFDSKQNDQDLRTQLLNVREQELKARLADRDRTLSILESEMKAFSSLFKKEQAKSAAKAERVLALQSEIESLRKLLASVSIRSALKQRTLDRNSVIKPKKVSQNVKTKISKQPRVKSTSNRLLRLDNPKGAKKVVSGRR